MHSELVSPALSRSRFEAGSFAALLDPEQWAALYREGHTRAFPRHSILMYAGEPGHHVMVLLEGRVKVTHTDTDGREVLLSIRGPGDILGELAWIDGLARVASVTALEPVKAMVIASADFRRYLDAMPHVALVLLTGLVARFRDAVAKRTQFPASDTIGRVAARLVELADRYGQPSDRGILIGLPLSQEELGAWVGASHAGVAKALQVLRELGWIETERRRIVVRDLDALRTRGA